MDSLSLVLIVITCLVAFGMMCATACQLKPACENYYEAIDKYEELSDEFNLST